MNLEQARFNMIEQQLRTWEVLDQNVLDLLHIVRREEFVPQAYRQVAFADTEIPLGQGVSMLPPKLEARALQALNLRKSDRVLEIGTGSGYMAALLAAHAAQVLTVEIIPELADKAAATLSRQGVGNVIVSTGDGSLGWPAQAPYDVIMISGALPVVPPQLLDQLKVGGRMLAFVGALPLIEAQRITRTGVAAFQVETLFETQVPALVCATRSGGFSF